MKTRLFTRFFATALLLSSFLHPPSSFGQGASPQVIPFQGRLTNQAGEAYAIGQYSIVFNLYTQAVAGTTLWTERHEKVGVVNGMVNVFLGSITPLTAVDFSTVKYLGITVDADNNPATADPEMVPRQMIIPAFYAKNSQKLAGNDWTAILAAGSNDPQTGFLRGDKLAASSVTSGQLANNSVTSAQLLDGAVTGPKIAAASITGSQLANNAVTSTQLADGAVTPSKLAFEYAVYAHQDTGANGGDAVGPVPAGGQVRSLNATLAQQGSSISRSGDTINLQPGVYWIQGSCPAIYCGRHQASLRIASIATTVINGTSEYSGADATDYADANTRSFFNGFLTVATAQSYVVWHTTQVAKTGGLGIGNAGSANIYTQIQIIRLK